MISQGTPRSQARRPTRPSYDPLHERATETANELWERAQKLADIMAPDVPADQEPLSDMDQWMLLERVALVLSPGTWDDPRAIEDLYKLRKMFMPQENHELLGLTAKLRAKEMKNLPDPNISPANPEFQRRQRALMRSG